MKTINIYDVKLDDNRAVSLVKEATYEYGYSYANTPEAVADVMRNVFDLHNKAEEHFYMLALSANGDITGAFLISKGSLRETLMHPREIFKRAILCNAYSIIVAHNHVSGSITPSSNDINATNELVEAGKLLHISVVDHLIVTHTGYNSLRENGYM